jgi:hypothetical protein
LTEWWKLKAQNQRDRWNHPDAVKRHYLAEHGEGRGPAGTAAKSPSPQQKQKAEVVRLQDELDAAEKRIRTMEQGQDNVSEGRDWTWQDQPEDIAKAWFRLYPTKAVRAASALLQLAKATTPKRRRRPSSS